MEQIRRWYLDDQMSIRDIGVRVGASVTTVWRHMEAAGIPRRPGGAAVTEAVPPEEDAAIRAALAAGEEIGDIAERLGRSRGTISRRRPAGTRSRQDLSGHRR